jgi:hypothetical protein
MACTGDEPQPEPVLPTSLAEAPLSVRGDAGDLGGSALTAGDLDGDGATDLVVAGIGGRVTCVVPGTAGAHGLREAGCLTPAADFDFAGFAVASGVDLDGDGADELLVGAPGSDLGGESAGAVWLVRGPVPPGESAVDAGGEGWVASTAADALGTAVAFAGDADGDGAEDALLGAPGSDAGARDDGAVLLVDARAADTESVATFVGGGAAPSAAKHAENVPGDGVGNAVCRAGDLDGDGLADVVVPAPGWDGGAENGGAVGVFAGPIAAGTWSLADADTLLLGVRAGGYAGGAVACGGDTDGDGRGELLVGADADGAGRVYLWRGGALDTGPIFVGDAAGDQAGYAVAFVPGSGGDAVAVGAPAADDTAVDTGVVAIFAAAGASGTLSFADADARWAGEGAGDLAGTALAGVADLDGAAGLLIGAPYNRDPAPIGGAAYGVPAP